MGYFIQKEGMKLGVRRSHPVYLHLNLLIPSSLGKRLIAANHQSETLVQYVREHAQTT